jgi:hypothetical protein
MQKTYRSIFISDVHLGTRDSQADLKNGLSRHGKISGKKLCQQEQQSILGQIGFI